MFLLKELRFIGSIKWDFVVWGFGFWFDPLFAERMMFFLAGLFGY